MSLQGNQRDQTASSVFVTLGFPFFTHCTKANVTDDQGLVEMLSLNIAYHYMGLKFYLEYLLGIKVDLVGKAMLHPAMRSTVEDEVIPVA